ncbi:poly + mrna-nucleus export-related protein [Moniliophthora roreri MCA 2997]|uniref:mRNA export factor GLE1 n=1 Tax=Moniliophthora roreri (strain MCA 2997) TaxID=1381753 RepID=V2XD84_MONRO|nr:poly + mrna-nucleus export-related protein [Moniliophthora roreri MCA 2997]
MRFSAPRSISPSPVRRSKTKRKAQIVAPKRHTSTFGLNSSSDDDDSNSSDSAYDSESAESTSSSSDSDSFCYASESEVPPEPKSPRLSLRSAKEQRYVEDTVAAIRLRTRHHDPYEEWEREMRKDSLRVARKEHGDRQSQFYAKQADHQSQESRRLNSIHEQQQLEVTNLLEKLRLQQQESEGKLRDAWRQRDKALWDRIESGIKLDQDKARAKFEEERRIRETEERRRREEEERRQAEEKRKREEEERKRKEAEEERKKKEEEEQREREEREAREREAKENAEKLQAEEAARKQTGMMTPEDDWAMARKHLNMAKVQGTRIAKADPAMKSMYLAGRRQITPKVGQVTNDPEAITRVSSQLVRILVPALGSYTPPVYTALLSALAKAFILQAETEVTAEKKSAEPLAQVAFNCLDTLEGFPEVFFARIVQRIGGWPIPVVTPNEDYDGRKWKDVAERRKVMGYKEDEGASEYMDRVSGVMRLYFAILKIIPTRKPLKGMWQMPRVWTWIARLTSNKALLGSVVGAQVLYVALEVLGADAKQIWGKQFIKLMALIYEGATTGLGNDKLMGGDSPEGIGARNRVKIAVENIMSGSS